MPSDSSSAITPVDLRSDTVTKPTEAMRAAMADATVADDVLEQDPTAKLLEETLANMLGKEAAVFMPSGTMTNQVALRVHCQPGDEFLCESGCHIYNYEQGGFAQLSGLIPHTLRGERGILTLEQMEDTIRPDDDHAVRTRLLTLENTHNRGGGTVQPIETIRALCGWAREHGLNTHLDGARLFNAEAASGVPASEIAAEFDSVSVCFSKGLGAPAGSALVGDQEFIRAARRARKLFGGAMRQVGVLAAGALHALQNHRQFLPKDHEHAKMLAAAAAEAGMADCPQPDSNIVLLTIDRQWGTAAAFVEALRKHDVWSLPFGPQHVRLVTHMDVNREQIVHACAAIRQVVGGAIHS